MIINDLNCKDSRNKVLEQELESYERKYSRESFCEMSKEFKPGDEVNEINVDIVDSRVHEHTVDKKSATDSEKEVCMVKYTQ
jgi:hypothetical protein